MAYTQQQMGYGQSLFPQYDVTEEETAANAQPFTQTIKIDPATGRQTMTLKGAPQDFTAANPYTPTVMGPVMPEAAPVQVASLDRTAGLPAVPQRPSYNIPSNMQESVFNPAAAVSQPAVPQQAQQPMTYTGPSSEPGIGTAQQMMPGEQVFAQTTTANAAPQTQQLFATEFDIAKADPIKLLTLSKDEGRFTPEQRNLFRSEAQTLMARDLRQRQVEREVRQEYEQATQTGNFSNLSKMLASKDDQGSFAKMILLGFISPELAGLEAKKLGLADQTQVSQITDANGKTRDVVVKVRNGVPISGYDSNENPLSPQDLLRVSSGQGVKTDLVGGTYVSDTEKDQFGRPLVGTVVRKTSKDGRVESYVQTDEGRKPMAGFRPQSSTGSLDMQRVAQIQKTNIDLASDWAKLQMKIQGAGPEAANRYLGEFNTKFQMNVPMSSISGPAPQLNLETGRLQAGSQPVAAAPAATTAPAELNVKRPQAQATAAPAQTPAAPTAVAPAPAPTGPVAPAVPGVARPAGVVPAQVEQQYALGTKAGEARITTEAEIERERRKPGAQATGALEAKDIKNQGFADSAYGLIQPIAAEIKKSTGSGIGTKVDTLAGLLGSSTQGAQAIAKLDVLSAAILQNIPRFEGPQSDKDVAMYKSMAGDLANSSKPIATRLAALEGLVTLMKKYDKAGNNDWSFGEQRTQSPGAAGQIPAGTTKQVGGVDYVFDGKGWKKK